QLARTPAMKADDHVVHATSHIKVAADGTVSGETEMNNSGVFASELRIAAALNLTGGDETFIRTRLQGLDTPGTGRINPGHAFDLKDPAAARATFTLSERYRTPEPGQRTVTPVGAPLSARPGEFLLPLPIAGRKSAFRCYAGREIEDIYVSFDPAWPVLPIPV